MKAPPALAILFVTTFALTISASEPTRSDALTDGLKGMVRSASVRVEKAQPDWSPDDLSQDPPILVEYLECRECEYDKDGNRIKEGQVVDGVFRGSFRHFRKDGNGRVIEIVMEDDRGRTYRREEFGPFGITEEEDYDVETGEVSFHSFWFYDRNGHPSGFRGYSQKEVLSSSSTTISDASGNLKEQWDYDHDGALSMHTIETNDPKTDVWNFKVFNGDGSLKVSVTTKGTDVIQYWQRPGEKYPYGARFAPDPVGKVSHYYRCHEDGTCDHVISYFPDGTRHNVSREEWHDGTGMLVASYDYEYELDAQGNWTKRIVRIWTPRLGSPRLYETDYRTLRYWE